MIDDATRRDLEKAADMAGLSQEFGELMQAIVQLLAYSDALNARCVADAADAERYRWLRSRVPGSAYRVMGVIYSEGGAGVDAAIDAVMAREPKS